MHNKHLIQRWLSLTIGKVCSLFISIKDLYWPALLSGNACVVCLFLNQSAALVRSQTDQKDSTIHNQQIVIFFIQPGSLIRHRCAILYLCQVWRPFTTKQYYDCCQSLRNISATHWNYRRKSTYQFFVSFCLISCLLNLLVLCLT